MAHIFVPPVMQIIDANGNPYSGAKLYFYQTGTTTLINVYQDEDFITPHANPVIADSSGRWDPIYLDENEYKIVIKTSADVTLETVDPVKITPLDGQTTTIQWNDSGATVGPDLVLYRNSTTPAAQDNIGRVLFQGEDSAGNTQDYAQIVASIGDPTSTSEDGSLTFATVTAGTMTTGMTLTGNKLTLNSTDAGATVGPTLSTYRDSASPAANDILGRVLFQGEDSAGNTEDYAEIDTRIDDATSASEDASLRFRAEVAGTMTTLATMAGAGSIGTLSLGTTGTAGAVQSGVNDQTLFLRGGNAAGAGAELLLYSGTIASTANDYLFRSNGSDIYAYDSSATLHTFANLADFSGTTVRYQQSSTNTPGAGNNTVGAAISSGIVYASAAAPHQLNRTTDAVVLNLNSQGVNQGAISISGATTTYAAFMGSHWSQLEDGSKPEILRGTICESIDELSRWLALEYVDHTGAKIRSEDMAPVGAKLGDVIKVEYELTREWLEEIEETILEEVVTPITKTVMVKHKSVEVINGVAQQIVRRKTVKKQVYDHFPVFAENGQPVMVAHGKARKGKPRATKQLIHAVPRMKKETVSRQVKRMVERTEQVPFSVDAIVVDLQNDQLPRFKISDTPGSNRVYGVFAWWDNDSIVVNDAYIGSLGAYVVRIAPGVTVQRGDYIESNGDGCGRVQSDDILRASTVAKVTSTTIAEIYPDGSYLVPCTLHCG